MRHLARLANTENMPYSQVNTIPSEHPMIPLHLSSRLSLHARQTLRSAETLARNECSVSVEPKHLLLALLLENGGLGSLFLTNAGLKRDALERFFGAGRGKASATSAHRQTGVKRIPLSSHMKTILSRAYLAASQFQSPYVGTEHLTYSLFENPDPDVTNMLDATGIEEDRILDNLEAHLGLENFPNFGKMLDLPDIAVAKKNPGTGKDTPFLLQYTTNLGEEAIARGEEFFGREEETDRIIRILGRKNKNNPLLIGEPGVGKTAIVSALAKRIELSDAPAFIAGKRILALDLALIVAGTSFRGEFESRLKEIVHEASEHPDVILFIDELHTIVGAGNTQGGLDAANILKPALARGDIRVIGATTLSEYKRHIEKDPALDRRFQSVLVREPSPEETKKLLRRIRSSYESFHGVSIGLPLLDLSVDLSVRHIHDRFLPDKAIDILDEAAALSKNKNGGSPEARSILALETTRKNILSRKELLMSESRFDEAAEMLEEEKRVSKEIARLTKRASGKKGVTQPRPTLLERDILETVTAMTGIPFSRLEREHPQDTLRSVGAALRNSVVHQEEAAHRIESALARALSDTRHPDRPIGSFLFLGPTGVGKTLIAKTLAESFFGGHDQLIRLDMSEFMERHSVAQMIGAPAGYVGYGDGGKLTERIRRTPHAVVLFDEIEKAHPDVFNILLQILDDGRLTDAEGRNASFRHAIIILTSNVGTEAFARNAKIGFHGKTGTTASSESVRNEVLAELKKTLRPELLARIDHTVVMNALGADAVEKIARLELSKLKTRLARKGITLSIPASIPKFIAEKSFAPEHGARLVRKHVDELVENAVAHTLLNGPINEKRTLILAVRNGAIVCTEARSKKRKR